MIDPLSLICFDKLGVLSRWNEEPERAMRPFDQSRTGFVMGEGAGILVLETREHARQRGARVLGGILGIATAGDAYRITDTPPEGEGARHAMRQALANAQLQPSDIDYINAHGTGTWLNDISECRAIRAVFEDQVQRIPVSSTKAALGHMIAAAGAVEAIICLEALRTAIIPPTLNLRHADAQCAVRHVYHAEGGPLRSALSNSFGFGGNNVSVVLTAYDG
jgi:3-oxoacyl-[acyl-carrier-protein] synthase II